jgi:hypothetical protein
MQRAAARELSAVLVASGFKTSVSGGHEPFTGRACLLLSIACCCQWCSAMSTTRFRSALFGAYVLLTIAAIAADDNGPARPGIQLRRVDVNGELTTFSADANKSVQLPASQAHANDRHTTFEASGLPSNLLAKLGGDSVNSALAARLLQVFVVAAESSKAAARQPLLGEYQLRGDRLCFEPRFPLEPGLTYEARLSLPGGTGQVTGRQIAARFEVPQQPRESTTRVAQVYPTSDTLPENQLKFYIHFSAPMSAGQAYRHVRLLEAAGKPIEGAFLEIGEELWDRRGQRFTLFFDPGRIKRGLKPREDLGPALEEGKSYTLVVDRGWQDANGNPLVAEFRKPFRVAGPDDTPPEESNWRIERPTRQNGWGLTVDFPEPLDHALLERVLWVETGSDPQRASRVPGKIEISRQETRWRFTPDQPLAGNAAYFLVVEKILEDRAGNHLGRKFEVDVFDKVDERATTQRVRIPISGDAEQ